MSHYQYKLEVIFHYGQGMNMEVAITGPDSDTVWNTANEYMDSLDTDNFSVVSEGWADEF
jgi:hypothetical protein